MIYIPYDENKNLRSPLNLMDSEKSKQLQIIADRLRIQSILAMADFFAS